MDQEKLKKIILEYENRPNSDLEKAMDFLKEDFDETKKNVIKMTRHLDGVEHFYNKLLREYKKRNKK